MAERHNAAEPNASTPGQGHFATRANFHPEIRTELRRPIFFIFNQLNWGGLGESGRPDSWATGTTRLPDVPTTANGAPSPRH